MSLALNNWALMHCIMSGGASKITRPHFMWSGKIHSVWYRISDHNTVVINNVFLSCLFMNNSKKLLRDRHAWRKSKEVSLRLWQQQRENSQTKKVFLCVATAAFGYRCIHLTLCTLNILIDSLEQTVEVQIRCLKMQHQIGSTLFAIQPSHF